MQIDFELNKIQHSPNHQIRIKELMKFLEFYFNNGRPKHFSKYENELKAFIPEIMRKMSFEELMYVVPIYYQFCYTVGIEKNFMINQKQISEHLLVPFSKLLQKTLDKLNLKPLCYDINENRYVIICRHAVTKGMYAPGSNMYSITSGLLNLGKEVVLVTIGKIDNQYIHLKKNSPNLTILTKDEVSTAFIQLINLRKICENFKPTKIITEMPVSIGTALYHSKISSKFLYWSPGFTQVPWFDKIMLVPEIYNEEFLLKNKHVEVPKSLNYDLINPNINLRLVKDLKKKYFISKKNFVMGTFSRYEKISEEFLELVSYLLKLNKNRKIIIAGTNDTSKATKKLKKFILNKQAILLGFEDVHILGHCCDGFLDTIPFPCGSSAIEIMAKGKPVLSLDQFNLSDYKKSRVNELIFENQDKLNEGLIKLENNSKFYNQMSTKSLEIAKGYDNSIKLAEVIDSL